MTTGVGGCSNHVLIVLYISPRTPCLTGSSLDSAAVLCRILLLVFGALLYTSCIIRAVGLVGTIFSLNSYFVGSQQSEILWLRTFLLQCCGKPFENIWFEGCGIIAMILRFWFRD